MWSSSEYLNHRFDSIFGKMFKPAYMSEGDTEIRNEAKCMDIKSDIRLGNLGQAHNMTLFEKC